ncbi:MAG: HAD hydrolase-like protein [Candidatus Brocadiae bacterium]|nr:HAD hydrolase-like protein [Candidatus Brocadiia bacterium]
MKINTITIQEILDKYETILLDAFGVLVYQKDAVPGAIPFIDRLNQSRKPYFILTNDAAHSVSTSVSRFHRLGLSIEAKRIITSGTLLVSYFQNHDLVGHGCAVLGTQDSSEYVHIAGGKVVPIQEYSSWDVLVVCDEMGFPFLENMDMALSMLFKKIEARQPFQLILPNPDLIYRKNEEEFGITAGSMALVLETALKLRYPDCKEREFIRLGKPYSPIFQEAYLRSGTKNMVMIGDQLLYDIRGAKNFGIASILIGTGVTPCDTLTKENPDCPDFILPSWIP